MITVYVGNLDRAWILPKDLLTHHSTFFHEFLVSACAEAETSQVKLREDDPKVFELFVQWLYMGYFPLSLSCNQALYRAKAWVMGDKLGSPAFRDHAMTHLSFMHNMKYEHPRKSDLSTTKTASAHWVDIHPGMVRFSYENSMENSQLRRWALDMYFLPCQRGAQEIASKPWADLVRNVRDRAADLAEGFARKSGLIEAGEEYATLAKFQQVLKFGAECHKLKNLAYDSSRHGSPISTTYLSRGL